ncbi:MAG TPA: hypothetical protein PKA58_07385, partial [Polyangium sp.]|nr:hypothetical protein [Polyangium sp.]
MTSFTPVGARVAQAFTTRVLEWIEAAAQRLNATRVDPDGRSFVTAVVDAATDSILVFVYDFHDKLREVGAFIFATDAPSRVELAVSVNLFSIERIESVGCRSFVAPAWFVEQDLRSSWCARRET